MTDLPGTSPAIVTGQSLASSLLSSGLDATSVVHLLAIAYRETSGFGLDTNVVNDNPTTGDYSIGLFQINMLAPNGQYYSCDGGTTTSLADAGRPINGVCYTVADLAGNVSVQIQAAEGLLATQGWTAWSTNAGLGTDTIQQAADDVASAGGGDALELLENVIASLGDTGTVPDPGGTPTTPGLSIGPVGIGSGGVTGPGSGSTTPGETTPSSQTCTAPTGTDALNISLWVTYISCEIGNGIRTFETWLTVTVARVVAIMIGLVLVGLGIWIMLREEDKAPSATDIAKAVNSNGSVSTNQRGTSKELPIERSHNTTGTHRHSAGTS